MRSGGSIRARKIITYTEVLGNAGSSFDKENGKFTVREPGLYMFTITATTKPDNDHARIYILKNDGPTIGVYYGRNGGKGGDGLSGSMMLQLTVGDVIRLRNEGANELGTYVRTPIIFTGQLLLPE